jgi:ankyrin repeat protein
MSRQRDETFAALTFAARAGDVEMVRNLLRHGADINGVDYDGRTALAQVKKNRSFSFTDFHIFKTLSGSRRNFPVKILNL